MQEHFGRYQLIERIALGGLLKSLKRGQSVWLALKKRSRSNASTLGTAKDSDFIAWMVDEAKLTSQLSHPNICQVLDFAKVDGHYFITVEYISGRDVYRIMKKLEKKTQSPVELVAYIGKGVPGAGLYPSETRSRWECLRYRSPRYVAAKYYDFP